MGILVIQVADVTVRVHPPPVRKEHSPLSKDSFVEPLNFLSVLTLNSVFLLKWTEAIFQGGMHGDICCALVLSFEAASNQSTAVPLCGLVQDISRPRYVW